MAVLGLPGGMEWLIICGGCLPFILIAVVALIIVQMQRNSSARPTATPEASPGWFADPSGRHEFRYWDGYAWTASVSDGGVTSEDPV